MITTIHQVICISLKEHRRIALNYAFAGRLIEDKISSVVASMVVAAMNSAGNVRLRSLSMTQKKQENFMRPGKQ